jgi:WASH complex subunit strumpellin
MPAPIIHFQPSLSAKGYPENYFARVPMNDTFVSMVIETLKSEDIYHQMQKFPSPEHRTIALATQSSMLFACLYFQPDTLATHSSRMREICDKFFYNNFIISIYMGLTVNLFDAWDGYKAAKSALSNILQPQMLKEITAANYQNLKRTTDTTRGLLKEGVLTEEFLLKNLPKIVKIIRECNFTARWWILNASEIYSKKSRTYFDIVRSSIEFNLHEQYDLILNISQLELTVEELAKDLLDNKEVKWNNFKTEVVERLNELTLLFSGEKSVVKVEKNDHLKSWFEEILKEVDALDLQAKAKLVERKLIQLVEAFSEVQEYHNLTTNAYAKQKLDEIISLLNSMIHLFNIKDNILVDLQSIGDFSYAWYLIEGFTPIIHESLQKSPNILIRLRTLFIKLATALEIPLMRINQCGGAEEFASITRYYSNELVKYVRKIVQIIPHSIFNILKLIIDLQTNHLRELPEKLEKDKLKEFAQLDVRYKIAKLTFKISVFTDGVISMKKTLVGVIELDPKQLLEDGIRKELVVHVADALDKVLQFNEKQKSSKELLVTEKLKKLAKIIKGLKSTFEYVQDYLNINGLLIWKEEMMRIVNYNVEQECNTFQKKKIQFSRFQSDSIPIPTFQPAANDPSISFIGRLAREILKVTDPKNTLYVDLLTTWYDSKSHHEIADQKFTNVLLNSIEIHGIVGLDKLFCFMISDDLEHVHKSLLKKTLREKVWIEFFQKFKADIDGRKFAMRESGKVENPMKNYQVYIGRCNKALPNILQHVLWIGQKAIWRKHLSHELMIASRINSKSLSDSLSAFNDALLLELRKHEFDSANPKPEAHLLLEVNKYLEMFGNYDPYEKVYIKFGKSSSEFLSFIVIFVLSHLKFLVFGNNLLKFNKSNSVYAPEILKHRKIILDMVHSSKYIDGHVFLLGVMTLLRQFHENNYILEFVDLFGSCLFEIFEYNLRYLCHYFSHYFTINLLTYFAVTNTSYRLS